MHRSIEDPKKFKALVGCMSAVLLNKTTVMNKPLVLSLSAKSPDATKHLINLLKTDGVEDAQFELPMDNEGRKSSPLYEGLVELLVRPHPGTDFKDGKGQDCIFASLHGNAAEFPGVVKYMAHLADVIILHSCPQV